MDTTILWRTALTQLAAVAILSLALGLALPHNCAILAGLPSLLAIVVGLHSAGALLAVALFALWCAQLRESQAVS